MATIDTCADCVVRDQSLCGCLKDDELTVLNRLGRRQIIGRGEIFVWAGDEIHVCANLLSGVMKLSASTPDGREQIVGLLYAGDFVGRPYAEDADFTITALTESELCVFPRKSFEKVLEDHVSMERHLLHRTFAALAEARGRMLMLARQSAEERIAIFLLDMAARSETTGCRATPDGPLTFDLALTRGQIADVLGLTIETVSRQLTKLKTAGVIALPGARSVTIRDRAGLAARAEMA